MIEQGEVTLPAAFFKGDEARRLHVECENMRLQKKDISRHLFICFMYYQL
jgi:hypothetical protein